MMNGKANLLLSAIMMVAGCVGDPSQADGRGAAGKADGYGDPTATLVLSCEASGGAGADLVLTVAGDAFDVEALSGETRLFAAAGQRPSLDVKPQDQDGAFAEFVEFDPKGLQAVPVLGTPRVEIELADRGQLLYIEASRQVELTCDVDGPALLAYLGLTPSWIDELPIRHVSRVGFDIDDTLMFTTPTFARGFVTGGLPKPDDVLFWTQTNGCDHGCPEASLTLPDGSTKLLPANVASTPKEMAIALVEAHLAMGHEVYAITARPDINGDPLRDYLESTLGIPSDHLFFEPDLDQPGNPKGKTDRIEALALDIFYGDSDSDITDAMQVTTRSVVPIRFFRSPRSSNRKDGMLNKYHPGYFGEVIVEGSYE